MSAPSFLTAAGCGVGIFGAAAIAMGVLLLSWVNQYLGSDPLAIGWGLAIMPIPLYVGLALWIDRYEPEPPAMLLGAFLWGSCIATLFGYMVNTSSSVSYTHLDVYKRPPDHTAVLSEANLLSPTGMTEPKYSLKMSSCSRRPVSVSRKMTPLASRSSRIWW